MSNYKPVYRRSFLGPIILIILGVIFLLRNLGVLAGDIWDTILQLWPLLLVAFGLDATFRREDIFGPVLFIGLGIVFLLANLGYLVVSVWQVIFTLWPLLLIAIGLDIVIGRRSIVWSLAGVAVFILLLFGALWMFGLSSAAGQLLAAEEIKQELGEAEQATITIAPSVGSLRIRAGSDQDMLVDGEIRRGSREKVVIDYQESDAIATFSLRSGYIFFSSFSGQADRWGWDLSLNPTIPLDLEIDLGVGQSEIDLRGLNVQSLDVNLGIGETSVVLPERGSFQGKLNGAIGQITIYLPRGMEALVRTSTGIASTNVPGDFQRLEDAYMSPGYDTAENRIELEVSQAIGNIWVLYLGGR